MPGIISFSRASPDQRQEQLKGLWALAPRPRTRSLDCLDLAKAMAQGAPDFAEYENRVRHRLASREIITSEEFHQRFPNGWTEKKEK